jgi:hypothetical protein
MRTTFSIALALAFLSLYSVFGGAGAGTGTVTDTVDVCTVSKEQLIIPQTNCVSFSVTSGTGCAWMCNYCASQLGTNNYYFTTGVCTYQTGGCVGNPQAGVTYTCCTGASPR